MFNTRICCVLIEMNAGMNGIKSCHVSCVENKLPYCTMMSVDATGENKNGAY